MNLYIKYILLFLVVLFVAAAVMYSELQEPLEVEQYSAGGVVVKLPVPRLESGVSVEEALLRRESIREYKLEPLTLDVVSQLLWSAQGVTRDSGGRTAPSAGGTYPLEIYVVVGSVAGLQPGVYHYIPKDHSVERVYEGDVRNNLAACALGQRWVSDGSIDIIVAADYGRTTRVYGVRGERYVHLEAGHAAQNIYLECVPLGCGTVAVGAFDNSCVKALLNLPVGQEPLYIMPVGRV